MGARGSKRVSLSARVALGAGVVASATVVMLGPCAPWLVDHLADGVRIWRLGRIDVDGVRGPSIAQLAAARVRLSDDEGVWLEAHNVSASWTPFELFAGAVHVAKGEAEQITILRKPRLSPSKKGGGSLDVALDDIRIARLDIEDDAVGEAGRFSGALALEVRDLSVKRLDAQLIREDSTADRAVIAYRAAPYHLDVDITSAPGAIFARALGVGEHGLSSSALGDGDETSGETYGDIVIGRAQVAVAHLAWTAQDWRGEARALLDALPMLAPFKKRFGAWASVHAQGRRRGDFTLHAESPNLSVDAQGALARGLKLNGAAQVTAETHSISAIAPEAPFSFGAAGFRGSYRREGKARILEGELDARELNVLGRRVRMRGPVRAELNSERFELTGEARADEAAPALFRNGLLTTSFFVARREGRFSLTRARLTSDALSLDAQGWARPGDGEFSGAWRVKKLEELVAVVHGAASGRWSAQAAPARRVWTAGADGHGEGVAGPDAFVAHLLGGAPRLGGSFVFDREGILVERAQVDGRQTRIGARGRIRGGVVDLALETSARGPVRVGGADIKGVVDATGRLSGRIEAPSVAMRAQLATLDIAGAVFTAPRIDFALAPEGASYRGRVDATARYAGQDFTAASDVAITRTDLAFPTLRARLAALEGEGEARFDARGAHARLMVNGDASGLAPNVSGAVTGEFTLLPQGVMASAEIANGRIGDIAVREARFTASGPFEDMRAQLDMRGALRRAALTFAGEARLSQDQRARALSIEGSGSLAGAAFVTRAPIDARWDGAVFTSGLDVAFGEGGVRIDWRDDGRHVAGAVAIDNAPIAPLAAIWGERAEGRVDGSAHVTGNGGLAGEADFTLADARFAGRTRGRITGRVTAGLTPHDLEVSVDAHSSDGLSVRFAGAAPVETSLAPLRVARARGREGHAHWSLDGPVESLWASLRLPDQALRGAVNGAGDITFGDGPISGKGAISLTDGRFEDKLSGVKLEDVDASLRIGPQGLVVERFSARDTHGGQLFATGGGATPEGGRVDIAARDMRLIDRPDAHMRASGALSLAWQGLDATLSGALTVAEGNVSVAQNPQSGIPQLDVIEINKPGEDLALNSTSARAQANGATKLDVRIEAPGRVYTRGRGLDAEWALDLRLGGTLTHPLLYGEARAVRGALSLSGQAFDITNGRIMFNGAPETARITLTAERVTSDLTARIVLSGTADNPDIAFESDPGLPEDEILPQVLFGRGAADLSGLEAAQLASSLAALTGRASFDIADAARQAAGLDRLAVRQDEDNGGLLVAGGVYLTRDVYVEVARTGLGQAASRVEWQVRPQLVLITSFLANGDRRASIRWRKESD